MPTWSAGCASGEGACTLAMVPAESLGVEAFRDRVKIYATDVDEEQLSESRQATYGEQAMQGVPAELRGTYFERTGDRFTFRKDLRRSVIFGRNDLVQDAPICRIDLLACRNTLMYFNAETQTKILSRFHFALADGGILMLGKAEMLLSHGSIFTPVDLKRRIFRRVPRPMRQAGAGGADQDPARRPVRGVVATSAGRSATSTCRTGRWSCAPTSSRRRSNAAPCGSTTSNTCGPVRSSTSRSRSVP